MVDLNTENFIQPLTLAMSSAISEMINEIDLEKFELIDDEDSIEKTRRFNIWFRSFQRKIEQLNNKTNERKANIFLNYLGKKAMEEYNSSVQKVTSHNNPFLDTVSTFKEAAGIGDCMDLARFKFYAFQIIPNERPLDTIKRIKKNSQLCEFSNPQEEIMKLCLAKIYNRAWLQRKKFEKWTKANLPEAEKFAREQAQLIHEHLQMKETLEKLSINEVKTIKKQRTCRKCAGTHEKDKCRAANKRCWNCLGLHHLKICCHNPNYITGEPSPWRLKKFPPKDDKFYKTNTTRAKHDQFQTNSKRQTNYNEQWQESGQDYYGQDYYGLGYRQKQRKNYLKYEHLPRKTETQINQ